MGAPSRMAFSVDATACYRRDAADWSNRKPFPFTMVEVALFIDAPRSARTSRTGSELTAEAAPLSRLPDRDSSDTRQLRCATRSDALSCTPSSRTQHARGNPLSKREQLITTRAVMNGGRYNVQLDTLTETSVSSDLKITKHLQPEACVVVSSRFRSLTPSENVRRTNQGADRTRAEDRSRKRRAVCSQFQPDLREGLLTAPYGRARRFNPRRSQAPCRSRD